MDSARYYDDNNPKKVYHLRLDPPVGSQYTYTVTRSTEFETVDKSSYLLKEIVDGTAVIQSVGDISSDSSAGTLNGTLYTADLKGKLEGRKIK